MYVLQNKKVLVVGLGASGEAACHLLRHRGAHVTAVDGSKSPALTQKAADLRKLGVEVHLAAIGVPVGEFDLAILSPGIPLTSNLVQPLRDKRIPVIGELELGYQQSFCLHLGITGTNGKTTTTELIARVLKHCHRKTLAAGNIGLPVSATVEQTRDLDFLTLEVSSFQLETIEFFRPVVGVLLNITPDHLDRYRSMTEYIQAKGKLFQNQQPFDWAIVQSEALAQLRSLKIEVPSKVITFSARNRRADLFLDRGLLVSRMPDWSGPLLDMDDCQLRGPHNAENLMAALAVGRVLRLPLEEVVEALKSYSSPPHRCEVVAEINGVTFINDSKATNLDALHKALLSISPGEGRQPNVWLLAGGRDKGFEYHDIGPLLSQKVKGAFLLGETREKLRAAWSLFTPCAFVDSLLEAIHEAAKIAVPGDVVLLSPACSSFDQFRNYQHRGEVFREAVEGLAQTTGGSVRTEDPNPAAAPKEKLFHDR